MRILLIGEYSGLHNALKAGLSQLGHQVTLLGDGDAFKKYPVDLDISPRFFSSSNAFLIPFRKAFLKIFSADPAALESGFRFFSLKKKLKGYDVVQLINENALDTIPGWEQKAVKFLSRHNKKLFLLSCGDDFYNVSYMLNNRAQYSILTPYFEDPSLKSSFATPLNTYQNPIASSAHISINTSTVLLPPIWITICRYCM